MHPIFLGGEGERCKSGLLEARIRVCQQVQARVANEKLYIFEEEWVLVGVSIIVGVFTRPQKEEEGQDDHVGNGSAKWGSKCGVGDAGNASYDLDRDWFDSVGR